jgi:hypothetical protein
MSLYQTLCAITKGRVPRDNRLSCKVAANIICEIRYGAITHPRFLAHGEQDDRIEVTAQQPCGLRIGSNRAGRRGNLLTYHQSQFLTRGTGSGKSVRLLVAQHFIEQRA